MRRFENNKRPQKSSVGAYFGAGYGNRTRDRGLGSDYFTIKLILQSVWVL